MTCSDIPPICAPKHRYEVIFVARIETQCQVATVNGKEKVLQGQGKVREFYFEAGKIDILKKSQGKFKII